MTLGNSPAFGSDCPSNQDLDRLREGELPARETILLEDHLRDCRRCQNRAQDLEEARERLLETRTASAERKAPLTRLRRIGDMAVGGVLALVVALGAFLTLPARRDDKAPATTTSGERFGLYVERDGQQVLGAPGAILEPSDRVKFLYRGEDPMFLTVLGIDAQAQVDVYYPSGAQAVAWSPEQPELPHSAVQADVLGPHVFVGVACPEPLPVNTVRKALEATASTPERFALLTCQIDLIEVEVRSP